MDHIFGGDNPQKSNHKLHLSFYFKLYCCGTEKNRICAFHHVSNPFSYPSYLIGKLFDTNWSEFWFLK